MSQAAGAFFKAIGSTSTEVTAGAQLMSREPADRMIDGMATVPPVAARRWGRAMSRFVGVAVATAAALVLGLLFGRQPLRSPPHEQPSAKPTSTMTTTMAIVPQRTPGPPPRGMVRIQGAADFQMGTADMAQLIAWCKEVDEERFCLEAARREPARRGSAAEFHLAAYETTNAEFSEWLERLFNEGQAKLSEITLEEGGARAEAVVGLAGRLASRPLLLPRPNSKSEPSINVHGRPIVPRSGVASLPVVNVSWYAADAFCAARGARLPTEAEWELAAGGVAQRRFPFGADAPECAARGAPEVTPGVVFGGSKDRRCRVTGPIRVGGAGGDVTPDGVYDLAGNVAEWVDTDGDIPATKVIRGGSFLGTVFDLRSTKRTFRTPALIQGTNVGFRCAWSEQ